MRVSQEIVLTFRDEQGELLNVAEQNGSTKFYGLRKLNKESVAELLGAEPMAK